MNSTIRLFIYILSLKISKKNIYYYIATLSIQLAIYIEIYTIKIIWNAMPNSINI